MQIIDSIVHFSKLHPDYAIALTFIMAFAESLIVVGGFIPGSLAITAIGILAGSGILNISSTFIAAIIGAILGDTGSFLIGKHFKDNLKNFFIFKQYPRTLKIGKHYFAQHGGKSVFFGRFIGPIRAIVPAVAGMMGMPIFNFLCANILSAIGWSALFFVPGVLIGMGHSQLQDHFKQLLIILAVVLLPALSIHYFRRLKLNVLRKFREQILFSWDNATQNNRLLKLLTPEKNVHPSFKTATELVYLILIGLGFGCSILLAKPFIHLSNYFLPSWLKYKTSIQPLLNKISFMNDPFHLILLCGLMITFICINRQFQLFKSWLIAISLGTIFDLILNLANYNDKASMLSLFNPFIIAVATQYLWLRCLLSYKPIFYLPILIVLITIWNLDIIFLTMRDQIPWIEFIYAGLLVGQISWLHARCSPINIQNKNIWLMILMAEMLIQLII
jgi:membrane protein DedA with SNARE-associated domain